MGSTGAGPSRIIGEEKEKVNGGRKTTPKLRREEDAPSRREEERGLSGASRGRKGRESPGSKMGGEAVRESYFEK